MDNENPEVTVSFKYTKKDLYYIIKETYRILKIPHIIIAILLFVFLIVLYVQGDSRHLLSMVVFLAIFISGIFIIAYEYFLNSQAYKAYNMYKEYQGLQNIEIYNDKFIGILNGTTILTYFNEMNKYYETRHNLLIIQNLTEKIVYEKGKIIMPSKKIFIVPKKYCNKEDLNIIRSLLLNSQIPRKHLL